MSCGRLSSILTVVNVSIFHFFSWCDSNCNPSIISRMCQTYFESVFSSIQFCCDNSTFCIVETTSINVVIAFWSRAVRIIKCWNLDFRSTSMLVTDGWDKMCGWQNLDIDNCHIVDEFTIFSRNYKKMTRNLKFSQQHCTNDATDFVALLFWPVLMALT